MVVLLASGVPAAAAELTGALGGTTQVVWQLAAWELQLIMQLVVVELCAKRIWVCLSAALHSAIDQVIAATAKTRLKPRKTASRLRSHAASITGLAPVWNTPRRTRRLADSRDPSSNRSPTIATRLECTRAFRPTRAPSAARDV